MLRAIIIAISAPQHKLIETDCRFAREDIGEVVPASQENLLQSQQDHTTTRSLDKLQRFTVVSQESTAVAMNSHQLTLKQQQIPGMRLHVSHSQTNHTTYLPHSCTNTPSTTLLTFSLAPPPANNSVPRHAANDLRLNLRASRFSHSRS